jgi:hypothetical protein
LKLNYVEMLLIAPKLINYPSMVQSDVSVIDVELLSTLVARLCNPENPKLASIQIEAETAKLRRWASAIDWLRWPLTFIGLFITAGGIIGVFSLPSGNSLESLVINGLILFGVALTVSAYSSLRLIQRRKWLFVDQPYDVKLPPEAEKVFLDLVNGTRKAVLLTDYGPARPDAMRTRDGMLVDLQIIGGTFLNRHTPLLASINKRGWLLVWLSLRHAFMRPVYVICEEKVAKQPLDTNVRTVYDSRGLSVAAERHEGQKWQRYFLWNLAATNFKELIAGIRFYDDEVKQLKVEIVLNAFYDGIHDEKAAQPVKPAHLYNRAAEALKREADLRLTQNQLDELQCAALRETGLMGKGDSIDWMEGVLGGNYAQICKAIEKKAFATVPNFKLSEK